MPRPFKQVTTSLMLQIARRRRKNPELTLAQLAELFGTSVGGMHKILKKLKEKA
jgi:DNA-binding IscR family transcriptional regulator